MTEAEEQFSIGEVQSEDSLTAGPDSRSSTYWVIDSDGDKWAFDYSDILTEGFRTIELGERVRFLGRLEDGKRHARYVVRLQDPTSGLSYLD